MSNVAKELVDFMAEDGIKRCRSTLSKKISPPFTASEELLSYNALLYLRIYNHNCEMFIGHTDTEIFVN
jgi:hypothetical protein